jgi:ribosome maturation protein SDO1
LDEVLQIPTVFTNVSKGQAAKKEDIQEAFPGLKEEQVIAEVCIPIIVNHHDDDDNNK